MDNKNKFKIVRRFLCYFEGQQEEMYFERVKKLVNPNYDNVSVDFNRISNINSLNKSSSSQNKLAIYDYDFKDDRFVQYAKLKNIRKLYTNVNFDLWLLLHKISFSAVVSKNDAYIDKIKKEYKLDSGDDIKEEKTIKKMLNQIELKDINFAINNAKNIMKSKLHSDMKIIGNFSYYDNPATNLHIFLEDLFKEIENNKI